MITLMPPLEDDAGNVLSIEHPINSDPALAGMKRLFYDQPGGAFVMMADASAHFLPEETTLPLVQALASKDGKEIFDYTFLVD